MEAPDFATYFTHDNPIVICFRKYAILAIYFKGIPFNSPVEELLDEIPPWSAFMTDNDISWLEIINCDSHQNITGGGIIYPKAPHINIIIAIPIKLRIMSRILQLPPSS